MISGFQNHLHVLYGLPGGWLDNADVLDRGAWSKRRKRQEEEEERLAIDILLARRMEEARQAGIIDAQQQAVLLEAARDGKQKQEVLKWLLMAIALDEL